MIFAAQEAMAFSLFSSLLPCRRGLWRQVDMSLAIEDWIDDLAWLHKYFYVGKCDGTGHKKGFDWPPA